MQTSRPRKPRFQRVGSARIELTARDFRIVEEVARHRFIQSHHLVMLLGGSAQHLVRRLGKLYHAGLLERPKSQIWMRPQIAASMVYCVTVEGRRHLLNRGYESLPPTPKQAAGAALFLGHALRLTDVIIAIRMAAARQQASFTWITGDVAGQAVARKVAWRCQWWVGLTGQRRSLVIPDGMFSLTGLDGITKYFVLEVDRGSMPVSRRNNQQSSFQRKIALYKETRRQGVLWRDFQIPAFRVLVVTESKRRLATIQKVTATMFTRGDSEMFMFGVAGNIAEPDWEGNWVTCAERKVEAVPSPHRATVRPGGWS